MKIGILCERPRAADALQRAVTRVRAHRVVWIAGAGADGVRLCAIDTPDLLLLMLPLETMDVVSVTRRIMAESPCAILIVTESVRASTPAIFDAVGEGALDTIDLPAIETCDTGDRAAPLLAKIATLGRIRPSSRARRADATRRAPRDLLLVIGASAGGPSAVATLLTELPKDFPGAIVVVQHVDEAFVAGMTQWLAEQSGQRVSLAKDGDRPASGQVLVAGGNGHLTLATDGRLRYKAEPRHCAYQPSVDVFFQSVSRSWRGSVIGVLLTGMGKDGAAGLKSLRDRGHHTIAQDEATSMVYGMPKAAAALNAAVDILPLEGIVARLMALTAA